MLTIKIMKSGEMKILEILFLWNEEWTVISILKFKLKSCNWWLLNTEI